MHVQEPASQVKDDASFLSLCVDIEIEIDSTHREIDSTGLMGSRKRMYCQTLITDLEYADDMCLIIYTIDEWEGMLQDLVESCSEMGLTISMWNTKNMAIGVQKSLSSMWMSLSTWEALLCQIVD